MCLRFCCILCWPCTVVCDISVGKSGGVVWHAGIQKIKGGLVGHRETELIGCRPCCYLFEVMSQSCGGYMRRLKNDRLLILSSGRDGYVGSTGRTPMICLHDQIGQVKYDK